MIIYGKQVCLYALEHHPDRIKTLYIAKKGILPQPLFERFKPMVKFLEEKWANAMSKGGNHQGILLEVEEFECSDFAQIKKSDFLLILDGLTDTGNIGAIIRSAYALGVEGVIATGVRQLNYAAITRTSTGALLDMPFMVADNILDIFNELHQLGYVSYGASMEGEPVESKTFAGKRVLVLGSEGEGLSKKARSKVKETVAIGMKHQFDSLNVSAAAAILIHRMGYAIR